MKNRTVVFCLIILFCFVAIVYQYIPFAAIFPTWYCRISMRIEWTEVHILYWPDGTHGERDRFLNFVLTDKNNLTHLQSKFKVIKCSYSTLGSRNRGRIVLKNGESWTFAFRFDNENEIMLQSNSDPGLSFIVSLPDNSFKEQLRDYCLANERKYSPYITKDSITF